ncbi:MAG: aminotransferase class V-fold PLP-dependent enzyme [Phycisphaerales bacterium]|nr:aminotransferase class V-fold PLP-dependent enzyme [Phycisphaerales bacterium]
MSTVETITKAVAQIGDGPLREAGLIEHIHPLFSRVLARNQCTNEIYLANHSLGRPLDALSDDVQECLDAWYTDIDGAWGPWIAERETYRAAIAALIGCARPDAIVPKTSAGQGLRAVLNALPTTKPNIVTTRGEFDSIDFILKACAHKGRASMSWVDADQQGMFHPQSIIDAITDQTDLVVVSMIVFATGQIIEGLERIIAAAHAHGALVILDGYHAFGVIEIGFEQLGADFIIGGNYKYTRGGPGACFLGIHPKHLSQSGGVPEPDALFTTDTGWFAKQDTFGYTRTDRPAYAPGGDAWLEATPPAITYFQARSGLALTNALGVDRLRDYSLHQQQLLQTMLTDAKIPPRILDHHGAFTILAVRDGPVCIEKTKAAGVNADGRPCPTTGVFHVRLCPDILSTADELAQAVDRMAPIIRPMLATD